MRSAWYQTLEEDAYPLSLRSACFAASRDSICHRRSFWESSHLGAQDLTPSTFVERLYPVLILLKDVETGKENHSFPRPDREAKHACPSDTRVYRKLKKIIPDIIDRIKYTTQVNGRVVYGPELPGCDVRCQASGSFAQGL